MNTRERFLEVMSRNPSVQTLKWEFGYWGQTLNNWYKQGLEMKNFAEIPDIITSPCRSMYAAVWHCKNKYREAMGDKAYPAGIGIAGGGIPWPQQSFPLETDIQDATGMHDRQIKLDLNISCYPMYDVQILKEDDTLMEYIDVDGITRIFHKETGVLPMPVKWLVKDKKDWEKLKEERFKIANIRQRLPKDWSTLITEYHNRDYPLVMGGYPHGYFGLLVHLMGYEHAFYAYFDDPELIDDMLGHFTELWIAVYSEVLKDVEVDAVHIWEDISAGTGSMVSPKLMRRFMVPYYKKLTSFLKSHGVKHILVDTDGDCTEIVPVFIEGGVTGLYPFEVECGVDIVQIRKDYPDLVMLGGVPKDKLALGKESIDELLKPVEEVLKMGGGYIPMADHLVPPDVSWESYKYFRTRLHEIIEKYGD